MSQEVPLGNSLCWGFEGVARWVPAAEVARVPPHWPRSAVGSLSSQLVGPLAMTLRQAGFRDRKGGGGYRSLPFIQIHQEPRTMLEDCDQLCRS